MDAFFSPELNKLYNLQVNLEKSTNLILEHFKKYANYDVYEYATELNRDRDGELEKLQQKIKAILGSLKNKIKLKNKQFCDITDLKEFKKEMIIIQENIQNMKCESKMKINSLEKEESDVIEDVNFYNEKIIQWTEPIKLNTFYNPDKPKIIKKKREYKEVKEFMDFVCKSGGHENGWRREDHNLFVKLRNKYKKIDIVAEHLHEMLPDISIEEIKSHEEWYKKYIRLQKQKKAVIKTWKKAKTKKKLRNGSNLTKILNVPEPETDIREKLNQWKAEREERLRNAREIENFKKQQRLEKEHLRKKRQEELKKIVQEWKQTKEIMKKQQILEEEMFTQHEKKRRAKQANRMIKQFQSQDDMYILKIRQQKKKYVMPQIRSKSSTIATRDPDRLLKPTQQWINRVHDDKFYSAEFPTITSLNSVPKLGVPEWRKELN